MFRFSTIIREPALNLAKIIFMLKHSVKLRRYLLCGCVTVCHGRPVCTSSRNCSKCIPDGHLKRVTMPDSILMQLTP